MVPTRMESAGEHDHRPEKNVGIVKPDSRLKTSEASYNEVVRVLNQVMFERLTQGGRLLF